MGSRSFVSEDNPINWWPNLIEQLLKPLSDNRPARYRSYDWKLKKFTRWHDLKPTDFVILEGVSASRKVFKPYLSYSIWLETPRHERLRRGLERDGETMRKQWEQWMSLEDAYIRREHPEQTADIVISGAADVPLI
ncbi:MAG TPA: hypothetical protein VGS08_00770 [Candidatus Saccharimonadales bacterium]|nr:hypothetical protein [Candidatus Saccharimonadales bacterium]